MQLKLNHQALEIALLNISLAATWILFSDELVKRPVLVLVLFLEFSGFRLEGPGRFVYSVSRATTQQLETALCAARIEGDSQNETDA